jgi:hypothetical protein
MTLQFTSSYRSRAWCARFAAGEVVELENGALIAECLEAGVAVDVTPVPGIASEPLPEPVQEPTTE